jgi:hypothetical protein
MVNFDEFRGSSCKSRNNRGELWGFLRHPSRIRWTGTDEVGEETGKHQPGAGLVRRIYDGRAPSLGINKGIKELT